MVCSLEASSQLARLGVNCSLSGDVLTPLPLLPTEKAKNSAVGLLEEDTGFAVCFTTQLSLVVRLLQKYRSCEMVGLGNEEDQRKAACSHQLPCFLYLLPLSLRLDMLHRTGPLPRNSASSNSP